MNRDQIVEFLRFDVNYPNGRSDLLDSTITTDKLISSLSEILSIRNGVWRGNIYITAVRTDHPTYDGPNGHSGGNAYDCYILIDAKKHFIEDQQSCLDARGVGLGGVYQEYADQCGGYNETSKLFQDNESDHVHIQVVGY